jgi:hypothetical protein
MENWAIAAVALAFLGLALSALSAAVLPGRDPLGLSERGRMVYVYAAEVLFALLCLHIRLTMPWLFRGFFLRWWPLIVMGLAFLGAGFSELFHRRHQRVLSVPLEHTSALLPILTVVAFWAVPSQAHFSVVLLTAGLLYTLLSVARRSFRFGLLAALAANGALWHMLYQTKGYGLLEHPQLWMIPPALCVLLASYVNRQRLTEAQMTAVRYMCAAAIYASSTADIFLIGVAQAPWLRLVLAGFAIVGIFAGILLRVRAFLYLGTAFLMLALFTMIWYAAVDLEQTWLWWATGIAAGVAIIAIFALFEKKREGVLSMVDRLKQWQP